MARPHSKLWATGLIISPELEQIEMKLRRFDKTYWLSIAKIGALWSLPIWAFVIVDAYRRAEGLPVLWKGVQHPGLLLHILLYPGGPWAAIHSYSWIIICIYSCLFYYVIVMLLVMSWRKWRKRSGAGPK